MKTKKYEEALEELELIAQNMEDGNYDIDELSAKLKEAKALIKLCTDKLKKADADVKKILKTED